MKRISHIALVLLLSAFILPYFPAVTAQPACPTVFDVFFNIPNDFYYYGEAVTFDATAQGDGAPLSGVEVHVTVTDPTGYRRVRKAGVTNELGQVTTEVGTIRPPSAVPPYFPFGEGGEFGFTVRHDWPEGDYIATASFSFACDFTGVTAGDIDVFEVVEARVSGLLLGILDLIGPAGSTLFGELAEIKADTEALSAQMALLEVNVIESVASASSAILGEIDAVSEAIDAVAERLVSVFDGLILKMDEVKSSISADVLLVSDNVALLFDTMAANFVQLSSSVGAGFGDLGDVVTAGFEDSTEVITESVEANTASVIVTLTSATDAVKDTVISAEGAILDTVTSSNEDLGDLLIASSEDLSTFLLAISVLLVITLLLAAVAAVRVVRLKS